MEEKGKGNKRVLSLAMRGTVVLLALMTFVLLVIAAAQPVEVRVNAPEYVEEGTTFDVTIDVDNITDFNIGIFDLSFDSEVVKVLEVKGGQIDETPIPISVWKLIDYDTIRVMPELSGLTTASGTGHLAKITFEVKGKEGEESILDISNGFLGNNKAEEIPAEWIDAKIRIVKREPGPTPTPPVNRVHNVNISESFSSIQAAIDDPDTKDAHIIEVVDGIYYENVKVTKSLTIRSENGSASCIVQAEWGSAHVFELTANYTSISGFTVKRASALSKAGIYLKASHCNISNNNCINNHYGIYLEKASNNTISNNNCLLNNEDGIFLSGSSNNTISNNNCSSNNGYGIELYNSCNNNTVFDNNCSNNWEGISIWGNNNTISNNTCSANNYGRGIYISGNNNVISNNICAYNMDGISLSNSRNSIVSNNTCSSNKGNGISLSGPGQASVNNIISNNSISSNTRSGIYLRSPYNDFYLNVIDSNKCGIDLGSSNNLFYLNNFVNNSENICLWRTVMNIRNFTQKMNYTHNGSSYTNYMGNYWDDYKGTDANNDGLGDIPYIVDRNNDNYPLMEPFENYDFIIPNVPWIVPKVPKVHNLNTGEDFLTIHAAIDDPDTKDGHVIEVEDGFYYENVKVTKSLTIRSENGSANCIVQSAVRSAVGVTADYVNISGFTVEVRRIYLKASYCNISNNNCLDNFIGISLSYSNNNTISNNNCSSNSNEGINLWNSNNNTISNNDCSNNGMETGGRGITLWASSNNLIINNTLCSNGWNGILVIALRSGSKPSDSSNNKIIRNNISNNGQFWEYPFLYDLAAGISLTCPNNSIINNTFINDGLYVSASAYQNTVKNNTVNGKPLVYLENESDREIEGAGQVILLNCDNITVEKSDLSHTFISVQLLRTNNTKITKNNISSNYVHGICLDEHSSNNSIRNNNINSNNRHGIYLCGHSSNNKISNNNISSNNHDGIHFFFSSNNTISTNNCSSNIDNGIYLIISSNNSITNNTFLNDGLYVVGWDDTQKEVRDNMVNGKPLVYLENEYDREIRDAGQVILFNLNSAWMGNST